MEQGRQDKGTPAAGHSNPAAASRKETRRLQAEQRKRLQPLRKKVTEAETELDRLHTLQRELEHELSSPGLYTEENKARLKASLLEKADVDNRCEVMEADWLEACEQLEIMQAELNHY